MRLARRLARKGGSYVGGVLRLLVALFGDLRGSGHRDGQQRWPGFARQAEGCCFNLSLGEVWPWKEKEKSQWEPVDMKTGIAGELGGVIGKTQLGFTLLLVFSQTQTLLLPGGASQPTQTLSKNSSIIFHGLRSRKRTRSRGRFAVVRRHHFSTKPALSQNQTFSHKNLKFSWGKIPTNRVLREDNENLGSVAPARQGTASLTLCLREKVRLKSRVVTRLGERHWLKRCPLKMPQPRCLSSLLEEIKNSLSLSMI